MPDCLSLNENRVSFDRFGDEVVVVHFQTGHYYSLTGLAADVWLWLVDGHDIASIVDYLTGIYADCDAQSIQAYAQQLVDDDLLETTESASGEPQPFSKPAAVVAFQPPLLQRFDDMQDLITLDPIHDVDDTGWPMEGAA